MGIYVKQSGKPWTTKKIAGNPIGDVALDTASTNNIQNKPVARKFSAVDTAISNEATARANADATKVNKSGDTMTGSLTIQNSSQPMLTLNRFVSNASNRSIHQYIDPYDNTFRIHDYINSSFAGNPLNILATNRIIQTMYNLDTYGEFHPKNGINNDAAWMDYYYNGVQRLSIYANNDSVYSYIHNRVGHLDFISPMNFEFRTNKDGLYVANEAWNQGKGIWAGSYQQFSSKLIKENIKDLTEEDGKKVLDLRPVSFDFKEKFGGEKNNIGLIAEETLDIMPEIVNIPDDYDESEFDEDKGLNNKLLAIDYVKLTPYLVKICQMQQKQIEKLSARIDALEKMIN